jgi:hypothetical protein
MTRDQFIAQQNAVLDEAFALTSGEQAARASFESMAVVTYEHLARAGMFPTAFPLSPNDPAYPLRRGETELLPPALRQRWVAWAEEYIGLIARNPRLALRDLIRTIGRTHNASSWPIGREPEIDDWIEDPVLPMPFDDYLDIITPEFYARLRTVRRRAGGMLYFEDRVSRVVFAPDEQWRSIKAELERRADEWSRMVADHAADVARRAGRFSSIIAAARGDTAFWSALRFWELAREAKRPPGIPPELLVGNMRPVSMTAEEREQSENPLIDPVFVAFIARVRKPGDPLTVRDIVLVLRAEMRGELGLDSNFVWPGGPGLGQS